MAVYSLVMKKHKEARHQFQFDVIRWILSSLLMVALIVLNSQGYGSGAMDIGFFGAVVVLELMLWITSRIFYRHLFTFPVNLENLQARWGVWVMIVIGESVIQLLHSFHSPNELMPTLVFMGIALLLLFTLAMQYFDACQVEWYEHALTKSALAGVSWIWLHVSMTHYLFRLGLWMKSVSDCYAAGVSVDSATVHSFSVSLGLVSGLTTIIRMSNSMPDSSASLVASIYAAEARSALTFLFRMVVSIIQIVFGFVGITDPLYLIISQCFLTMLTTALDVVNEIQATSLKMKEAEAKASQNVAIKSLKQFPRQWSRLQLVRKESLLQMNLMDDEGGLSSAMTSSKSLQNSEHEKLKGSGVVHDTLVNFFHGEGRRNSKLNIFDNSADVSSPMNSGHRNSVNSIQSDATDESVVLEVDLKKAIEKQLLKQERVSAFDSNFKRNSSLKRPLGMQSAGSFKKQGPSGNLFRYGSVAKIVPLGSLPEAVSELSRRLSSRPISPKVSSNDHSQSFVHVQSSQGNHAPSNLMSSSSQVVRSFSNDSPCPNSESPKPHSNGGGTTNSPLTVSAGKGDGGKNVEIFVNCLDTLGTVRKLRSSSDENAMAKLMEVVDEDLGTYDGETSRSAYTAGAMTDTMSTVRSFSYLSGHGSSSGHSHGGGNSTGRMKYFMNNEAVTVHIGGADNV
jgi:low temperature requirement protein LtrA